MENYLQGVLGMKIAEDKTVSYMEEKLPYNSTKIKEYLDTMCEPLFDHVSFPLSTFTNIHLHRPLKRQTTDE